MEKYKVKDEYIKAPDGVKLFTRIITPKGEKHPIVFIRTPYADKAKEPEYVTYERFLVRGYAMVIQHCRGTGKSEGECIPYENEREDALFTLDFIRALDFYNEEIYLFGGSYLSTVHLTYLSAKPHDVKGAVLEIQTDRMYFRNYQNGCNYNLNNAEWWFSMAKRSYPSPSLSEIYKMPYIDVSKRVVGEDIPKYTQGLINNEYNEFWKNDPRENVVDYLDFPILFVEGWYDFYVGGMFSMWERLSEECKKKSAFIVGPWGHSVKTDPSYDYKNISSGNLSEDFDVEWFESVRRKEKYKYAQLGQVSFYLVGADLWFSDSYPKKYDTVKGAFSELYPTYVDDRLEYTYDPKIKNSLFSEKGLWLSKETDCLPGVTSFYTDYFDSDKSFFGKIKFYLSVSSDRDDTAFYLAVNFSDEGSFFPLTEAITSVSHLYPNYKAGEKVILRFETAPIAFKIKKGERIRFDLASNGGKYIPHSNQKEHWAFVKDTCIAKNTVYLGESYFYLPIL